MLVLLIPLTSYLLYWWFSQADKNANFFPSFGIDCFSRLIFVFYICLDCHNYVFPYFVITSIDNKNFIGLSVI